MNLQHLAINAWGWGYSQRITQSTGHLQISEDWHCKHMLYMLTHNHRR